MDLLTFARGPALKVGARHILLGRGVAHRRLRPAALGATISMSRASRCSEIGPAAWWPWALARGRIPQFIARTGAGEALGYSYHLGLFALLLAVRATHHVSREPLWHHLAGLAEQPDHRDLGTDPYAVSRGAVPARDASGAAHAVEFR